MDTVDEGNLAPVHCDRIVAVADAAAAAGALSQFAIFWFVVANAVEPSQRDLITLDLLTCSCCASFESSRAVRVRLKKSVLHFCNGLGASWTVVNPSAGCVVVFFAAHFCCLPHQARCSRVESCGHTRR